VEDEESKIHAREVLELVGYDVQSIPPHPSERRADLEARRESEILIVEAKGKDAHQLYLDLVDRARAQGGASLSREIVWNGLSKIVKEAHEQLLATPAPAPAPRILCVSCLHSDARFVFEALERHLYGLNLLALWRKTDDAPQLVGQKQCFYYERSDFRRYQGIDAVLLAGPSGSQLLVNEYGLQVSILRRTRLFVRHAEGRAACDPVALVDSGAALAIRSDEWLEGKARWQYIFDNYGYMHSPTTERRFTALGGAP